MRSLGLNSIQGTAFLNLISLMYNILTIKLDNYGEVTGFESHSRKRFDSAFFNLIYLIYNILSIKLDNYGEVTGFESH